jgi:bacillolysin
MPAEFQTAATPQEAAAAISAFGGNMARFKRMKPANHQPSTPPNPSLVGDAVHKTLMGMGTWNRSLKGKPALSQEQRDQLQALTAENTDGHMVRVQFNAESGTVDAIKLGAARIDVPTASFDLDQAQTAAARFLSDQRDLLAFSDPTRELRLKAGWMDELGIKHFRYQQMIDGIPVWSQEASVHLDGGDRVYYFNGRYTRTPKAAPVATAEISAGAAAESALRHLGVPLRTEGVIHHGLVFVSDDANQLRLAYHMSLNAAMDNCWDYFVDARSGEVLKRISKVMSVVVNASGVDLNGVRQNFIAWQEGSLYGLIDPTAPLDNPPYEPLPMQTIGNIYVLDALFTEGDSIRISLSTSPTSGWDPAGVSLMASVKTTLDYFSDTFGRRSLDDDHLSVVGITNFGAAHPNAYWNGKLILFGSGDGQRFTNLAGSLDVIAHEMQHAVTQFTAGLIYENQSGALNEAYSDITGCMVDRDDWLMGEDITIPAPGHLRDLVTPANSLDPLPGKMSDYQNLPNTEEGDFGGVHVNCLIPAHAAYLMAEGLTAQGLGSSIGREQTEQIFYRALTAGYLLPYSQFLDAREATLQAAEDLYGAGSSAVAAVQAAWDAVEVVPGGVGNPNNRTPTPTDPASGEDLVIYLYPSDGSHDRPFDVNETYDLYVQTIPSPFSGYDRDLDLLVAEDLPNYTRPAAITTSSGTLVLFAGRDYNLYLVPADGSSAPRRLTDSGDVYSVAASPDGRWIAYTTPDAADNHIYLFDLSSETAMEVELESPTTDDPREGGPGTTTNTILYADALAFDYTSSLLVFDLLNCISTPESNCSADGGLRYFSIGILDLSNGQLIYPASEQSPSVNYGYPTFATNNNFVIALDVLDLSQVDITGEIASEVISVNFENGSVQSIAQPNRGSPTRGVWGVPSFWGDDDYVTVQVMNDTNGSLARVPVNPDWSGQSASMEFLNDYDAAMPLMHRAGVRNMIAEVQTSTTALNFGSLAAGQSSTEELILQNAGNRDISITNIATSGKRSFDHNGTNCLLPRGQQMTIKITYFAGTTVGSESDTLNITSDADAPSLSISLVGQSLGTRSGDTSPGGDDPTPGGDDPAPGGGDSSPDGGGDSSNGGGGGGGCFLLLLN